MRLHSRGDWLGITVVAAVLTGAPACASGASSRADLQVQPVAALVDAPARITIGGLRPGENVDVRIHATDLSGMLWISSATVAADNAGRVDMATAVSSAGSYTGVEAMGLFRSMCPASGCDDTREFVLPVGGAELTVSVDAGGRAIASRHMAWWAQAPEVQLTRLSLDSDGIIGIYYEPPAGTPRHRAVLIFGGSDGGLNTTLEGALLASHGYPALALAYFKEPGLPVRLANIPLEYFAKALAWLRARPEVDPARVVTFGISRGSEAALLLGVHYPELVHGVVALVPSDVSLCSFPGCTGPAWTLGGSALPFTRQFNEPQPTDVAGAVIDVDKIRGPVFLDCGGADRVWQSCPYAAAIDARLATTGFRFTHELLRYPDGGHGVGVLVPNVPGIGPGALGGATRDANARARADGWPRLLAFLAQV